MPPEDPDAGDPSPPGTAAGFAELQERAALRLAELGSVERFVADCPELAAEYSAAVMALPHMSRGPLEPGEGEKPDRHGNYWRTTEGGTAFPALEGQDQIEAAAQHVGG